MGCCASSPDEIAPLGAPIGDLRVGDAADAILVPVPLPRTLEDWARAGTPALLRVHSWLRVRALENAPRLRGTSHLMVRMSYFMPPLGRPSASPAGVTFFDSSGGPEEEEGEPIEEDDAGLRAVASNLGNSAFGAPNLLHLPAFCRAAAWVSHNTALLAAECDATFLLPCTAPSCHTLAPPLPVVATCGLLRVFRDAAPAPSAGYIDGPDVALLLGLERKASLLESVFFPILFRSCARGPGETCPGLALAAPQWVTAVDAFCSLSEQALLRLSFYHFARVGLALQYERDAAHHPRERLPTGVGAGATPAATSAPPPTPYIAVSSLPSFFPEFREAVVDPMHPSRPLLDEMRLRARVAARAEKGGAGSSSWRGKEAAYAAFIGGARRGMLPALPPMPSLTTSELTAARAAWTGTGDRRRKEGTASSARAIAEAAAAAAAAPPRPPPGANGGGVVHSPHARHVGWGVGGDWGDEADRKAAALEALGHKAVRASWAGESPGSALVALMKPIAAVCTGPEDMLSWEDYVLCFKRSPGSFFDLIYYQRQLRKVRGGK